jgi:RHS repeat-associated protein
LSKYDPIGVPNGAFVASFEYDTFGNKISERVAPDLHLPFQFSTKYFDAETGLSMYQRRPYIPPLGSWLSRNPIEERDVAGLYLFVKNDGVNKWDKLGQKTMPHLRSAAGLTANGLMGLGGPVKHGELGLGTCMIFFPATCEIGVYQIYAGIGKNLEEWRPVTKADFNNDSDAWMDFQAGLTAGIGVGIESAYYTGSGIADAASFSGIFNTVQGTIGLATAGGYASPDGNWIGGTLTFGPGLGIYKVDWLYSLRVTIDLDDKLGLPGRCACAK